MTVRKKGNIPFQKHRRIFDMLQNVGQNDGVEALRGKVGFPEGCVGFDDAVVIGPGLEGARRIEPRKSGGATKGLFPAVPVS